MNRTLVITNQSSSYLTTNIANAFVSSQKYDQVVLMAGNEISPLLKLDPSVIVVKIPPYDKQSFKARALSWIKGTIKIIRLVRKNYHDAELFLISNPPTVAFVPLFLKNKYSTLVYDVYPNGLVEGKFVSEKNIIFKIWTKRNKKFYAKANRVFTITDGMANTISEYCDRQKIEVVNLWCNPNLPVLNIPKNENIFLTNNNLQGKFIIMYSGNMGKGSNLDVLVDVANNIKEKKDIVFLFVGEGALKPIIQEKISALNLQNVILLPYQDRSILPYSLSCADLAVVAVGKGGGKVCIPSKTFDLMKLGEPILCIAEPDSDIVNLVNERRIGKTFSRKQISEITDFILDNYQNPSKLLSFKQASFEASKDFTSKLAENFI